MKKSRSKVSVTAAQLPLGIGLKDGTTFENFYPAGNELILQTLQEESEQYLYLWGARGTGKSHLLQGVCHAATAKGQYPTYLPLQRFNELAPAMLDGLEQQAVVVLDDLQFIAGQAQWEQALFHLYNRVRDAGARMVVSAHSSPGGLSLGLADLASRLSWGPVFHVEPLNDDEKRAALQLRSKQRGILLSDDVAEYMLRRVPRDMESLFNLLNQLDQASMAAQRKLTIPFVRELMSGSD